MTDRTPFEARLADRLAAHTTGVVRPFDAAGIAAQAAARAGGQRRLGAWPRLGLAGGRLVGPAFVWLALVALLLALVGATLLTGGRPALLAVVQATATATPTPAGPPSPSPIAILPGEPWIAYASTSGEATGAGLILVREDGTDRHEILSRPDSRRDHPDWSRDGAQLAFEDWHRDATLPGLDQIDIWISDADGGNPRQVTQCEAPCLQRSWPAWSPDGTQLALVRYDLLADPQWGPSAIEILDLATGDIRVVSETKDGVTAYYTPRWSPDGSKIVFAIETYSDATETKTISSSLAIVNADGSNGADPRILTTPGLLVRNPDWHPLDDRIVFEASSAKPGSTTTDLYVIGSTGSGLTNLTNSGSSGLGADKPTWTPDGLRISFSQQTGPGLGTAAAFIDANGSNATRVSSDLAAAPRLRPTP